jgi:hypothetical protein
LNDGLSWQKFVCFRQAFQPDSVVVPQNRPRSPLKCHSSLQSLCHLAVCKLCNWENLKEKFVLIFLVKTCSPYNVWILSQLRYSV